MRHSNTSRIAQASDSTTQRLFECLLAGSPQRLAESCISLENPETFTQCPPAAQRQQRNELRIESILNDYEDIVSKTVEESRRTSRKRWRWRRTGETVRTWREPPGSTLPLRLIPKTITLTTWTALRFLKRQQRRRTKRKRTRRGKCHHCGRLAPKRKRKRVPTPPAKPETTIESGHCLDDANSRAKLKSK